jgi:heme-degrading monooxygenase HmoA
MITRFVKMTFREEKVQDFLKVFEASKNKIRNFPGCEHVELLSDVNDPRIYFTFSKWRSEDDLNKYRYSELFKITWSNTKIHFEEKPEVWSLTLLSVPDKVNS